MPKTKSTGFLVGGSNVLLTRGPAHKPPNIHEKRETEQPSALSGYS